MKEQVIYGVPPSKSNCYKVVTIHGHGSLAKTAAMREWERSFYMQCGTYRDKMIKSYFKMEVDVYFPSQRSDLDNAMKGILDCLQACRAIDNDRWLVELHARKFIDKYRPRVEFTITPVEGIDNRTTKEPDLFE
jgi:Holliday junction resolvase RusA-like endonuclease